MAEQARARTVDEYLAGVEPKLAALAEQIRALIKRTLPDVTESLNSWGYPLFATKGREVAWMIVYKNHLNFGFTQGAQLRSSLLEGTGKNFRHVKVKGEADIKQAEIARLLNEAAKLPSGR
jgi:hypothetical protein